MAYIVCVYTENRMACLENQQPGCVVIGSAPHHNLYFNGGFELEMTAEFDGTGALFCAGGASWRAALGETVLILEKPAMAAVVYKKNTLGNLCLALAGGTALRFGRGAGNNVMLPSPAASSHHAIVEPTDAGWLVRDLDSANHVYVNGQKAAQALLKAGDEIFMAGWIFAFRNNSLCVVNAPAAPVFAAGLHTFTLETPPAAEKPYPVLVRSPRVRSAPLQGKVEFLFPPKHMETPDSPMFDTFARSAAMALTGIGLVYAIPNVVITLKNRKRLKKKAAIFNEKLLAQHAAHLDEVEKNLSDACTAEFRRRHYTDPALPECLNIARTRQRRLWERRADDPDFLSVRLGLGTMPSGLDIQLPRQSLDEEQNAQLERPRLLHQRYSSLQAVPVCLPLQAAGTVGVYGERGQVINCVGAMLAAIATHHAATDVKVVCIHNETEMDHWAWVRWLPHCWGDDRQARFWAPTREAAKQLLDGMEATLRSRAQKDETEQGKTGLAPLPRLIFVLADKTFANGHPLLALLENPDPALGIVSIFAYGQVAELPPTCGTLVECAGGQAKFFKRENYTAHTTFAPDEASPALLDALARALAPVRLPATNDTAVLPACVTFLQGYGAKRCEELDVPARWRYAHSVQGLPAPIGTKAGGDAFIFDLHDTAMGPHGLVAGTTGSGKSEFLQTLLLSLAVNYPPQDVAFVLVDFKGESFAGTMKALPHVAGIISNISAGAIRRNLVAIKAELTRRQALLAAAKLNSIDKYQQAVREGRLKEPIAHLLIVIDEFAELKRAHPDFMNTVLSIAATGRSLGVHLILATQAPSGVVDTQVLSNTRFIIALKTANKGESNSILGTPDAAAITVRGRAIVKVGNGEINEQVQTYWSGAEYVPGRDFAKSSAKIAFVDALGTRIRPEVHDKTIAATRRDEEEIAAVAKYVAATAAQQGFAPARAIWNEELPCPLALAPILPKPLAFRDGAYHGGKSGFAPVVGLVDAPNRQRQYPLVVDLPAQGHTLVYGSPQSGKSTFLHSFILAAAQMYTPDEVVLYGMDFGGLGLSAFKHLPHVGGVAAGGEEEMLQKLALLLTQELAARRKAFAEEGTDNISAYRSVSGKAMPYLALLVDNFEQALGPDAALEGFFLRFLREGGGAGMFLLASCGTPNLSFKITPNITQSLVLQMADPASYAGIVGKTEGLLPAALPGRGLVKAEGGPYEFQVALAFPADSESERIRLQRDFCRAANAAWNGARPGPVLTMPRIVRLRDVPCPPGCAPLGLATGSLAPLCLPPEEVFCMMVSGLPQSGKSNLLHLLARPFLANTQARVLVYSPCGQAEHLPYGGQAETISTPAQFDALLDELVPVLTQRLEQHKNNEAGFARIAIFVDDYDQLFEQCYGTPVGKTILRLGQIAKLGAGLDVFLYLAGNAAWLKEHRHKDIAISSLFETGYGIALGGTLGGHPLFKTENNSRPQGRATPYEGWLFGPETLRFKAALAQEDTGGESNIG